MLIFFYCSFLFFFVLFCSVFCSFFVLSNLFTIHKLTDIHTGNSNKLDRNELDRKQLDRNGLDRNELDRNGVDRNGLGSSKQDWNEFDFTLENLNGQEQVIMNRQETQSTGQELYMN